MKWISITLAGFLLALAGAAPCDSCTVSVTPLSFGEYDMFTASPLDTVTDLSVACSPGIIYNIKVDAGLHSMEDFHSRRMRSFTGDTTLGYNLYRNIARTEVLGDGIGNTFTMPGSGTGGTQILRIYGRIPARQMVESDLYTDSIAMIVEW